ncbi:MAG TPA: hypothetical protein VG796_22785 [Verrucomicrobiales bacterium]|nr:hypothetical protein [Verrucomicrobiales bacterium]
MRNEPVSDDPGQSVTSKRWTKVRVTVAQPSRFCLLQRDAKSDSAAPESLYMRATGFRSLTQNGTSGYCFGSG